MDIKMKVLEFIDDRRKINNLIDVINHFLTSDEDKIEELKLLEDLFGTLLKRNDFTVDSDLEFTNPKGYNTEVEFTRCLTDIYERMFKILCNLISDTTASSLGNEVFRVAMNLIAIEGRHPIISCKNETMFPEERLKGIIQTLLQPDKKMIIRITQLKEYTHFCDVLFYSWKILKENVIDCRDFTENYIYNLIELLDIIYIPKQTSTETLCYDDPSTFTFNATVLKRWVSQTWLHLVKINFKNSSNHRKMLLVLMEKYLNTMSKPVLFTDFFMASLSDDVSISLLALQGMSTLVQKHNLECPNIFGKLYCMLQPDIFDTKYKTRLFYLTDLFLSSSHVPEKLVGAFVKRLSRLTLVSPTPDIIIMLKLITNLLIRHPALKILMNNAEGISEVEMDPYLFDEPDPLKSKALESSLWEVAILKRHAISRVSSAAKFIDQNLPALESDLTDVLDVNYEEIFNKEIKKNPKKDVPINFLRPSNLSALKDDRVYKLWGLSK